MKKIHISTVLNSKIEGITSFDGFGMLKDKEIIFYENDIKVVIQYSKDFMSLKRVCSEYTITLLFQNTLTKEGIYDIKCDGIQIPIQVTTKTLIIKENSIHLEYDLVLGDTNQGTYIYDIQYEVVI